MTPVTALGAGSASPVLRDRFLCALDESNELLLRDLAAHLCSCANILPSTTCGLLGLPVGSTYAAAARVVIGRKP